MIIGLFEPILALTGLSITGLLLFIILLILIIRR